LENLKRRKKLVKNLLKSKKILVAVSMGLISVAALIVPVLAAGVPGTVHPDLILDGSTTLGPVMVQAQPAFNTAAPGLVTIPGTITQTGSSHGLGEINNGLTITGGFVGGTWAPQADVADSSRALKTSGSVEPLVDTLYPVSTDAVIAMVNGPNTPADITQITKQQLRGIYEGAYALTAAGGDGTHEYWDAGSVTIPSTGGPGGSGGLLGSDGNYYDAGVTFPALPGNGVSGNHVQIVPVARILNSGTRAFFGDSIAHGGNAFASLKSGATDPYAASYPYASYYPVEEQYMGPDSGVGSANGQARVDTATQIQTTVNNATNSVISYSGYGYSYNPTTAPNIRDLKLIDDISGSDRTAYAATQINIYSYHYHLSRYLYLGLMTGISAANNGGNAIPADPNHANEMQLVNWMQQLDGAGQAANLSSSELQLIPNEAIKATGPTAAGYSIGPNDLTKFGNDYGKIVSDNPGDPTFTRSDVLRISGGTAPIGSRDLTDLGNWYGVTIQAMP
jgi:hypothetical protein